ncbi:hypothetical protein PG994_006355, partial [Apiospora phragmitis]
NTEPGTSLLKADRLEAFFSQPGKSGLKRALEEDCTQLHKDLFVDGNSLPLNIQNRLSTDRLDSFSNETFRALEHHTKCDPTLHVDEGDSHSDQSQWHPTRICLAKENSKIPTFNFLVSTMDMAYWQDFLLEMYGQMITPTLSLNLYVTKGSAQFWIFSQTFEYQLLWPGRGESLSSVLRYYDLKIKDKLVLAYNIARAYMMFYDSKLKRMKWTSSNIYFMPVDNGGGSSPASMPLRAYLSFPSGKDDADESQEFIRDELMTHSYPRIFDLGILLLEIGLGETFPTLPCVTYMSRVNSDHRLARNRFRELKSTVWKGFEHKSVFDEVVSFCVEIKPSTLHERSSRQAITERTSSTWLSNLWRIGTSVVTKGSRRPVIAILDTGLDPALLHSEFGEDATSRIEFKDFVDGSGMVDNCGHGTFMIGLAMKCAPFATIVVARIAANSKELEGRQQSIAKAIEWAAGGKQKAYIISMSFGFPRADIDIENAIQEANKTRGKSIILLASAGNSASDVECFPARLDSVMSIHATDPYGYFLKSSSIHSEYGPVALGTYGDSLPREFLSGVCTKYPNAIEPGSSVATAVAAGISATFLSYVDALPALGSFSITERDSAKLQRVWETRGMEALFKHMKARCTNRQLWVDPISFWRDCGSHDARYRAILGCMEDFDRLR